MDEITIHIFLDSEGYYQYNIFKGSPEEATETEDSEDGGCCTSSMQNAIDMAAEQAKALVPPCPDCVEMSEDPMHQV